MELIEDFVFDEKELLNEFEVMQIRENYSDLK